MGLYTWNNPVDYSDFDLVRNRCQAPTFLNYSFIRVSVFIENYKINKVFFILNLDKYKSTIYN